MFRGFGRRYSTSGLGVMRIRAQHDPENCPQTRLVSGILLLFGFWSPILLLLSPKDIYIYVYMNT